MLSDDRLFVRVKVDNAKPKDTAIYWWSNIAVDERPDTRVFVPSERAYHYGYGKGLSKVQYDPTELQLFYCSRTVQFRN